MSSEPESPQQLVDRVFRRCMAQDKRHRVQVVQAVHEERRRWQCLGPECPFPMQSWSPTTYELHVMISRVASREDEHGSRQYFPAYDQPRRYLSLARIRQWCELADERELTEEEAREFRSQLRDLESAEEHWNHQLARVRRVQEQLNEVSVEASVLTLQLPGVGV